MKQFNLLILIQVFLVSFQLHAQQIEQVKATGLLDKMDSESGVLVINFWSTWCKPCVEEIPHFLEVYQAMKPKGVQLWLVSQDTRSIYQSGKLKTFIKGKKGWDKARLFWFDETDADYYCPIIDKGWSGVIPATLIINRAKGYHAFIEDSISAERLQEEIDKAL